MASKGLLLGTVFNIPPPFSPDALADLSLWLDAADVSTISTTGDLLDQWDDKSLAGITGNFTPWDNSQKCNYGLVSDRINGLNVVNFPQIGFPYIRIHSTNVVLDNLSCVVSHRQAAIPGDQLQRITIRLLQL